MADCEVEPGCRLDYGAKLNLEKRCVEEPTPVACLGADRYLRSLVHDRRDCVGRTVQVC